MVDLILSLCKKRGISREELEIACDLGKKSIYNWDKNLPSVDKVQRVAKMLGVSVEYLLGVEEASTPSVVDPELALAIRAAEERPELRVLFSLGSKATKEDVEAVIRLLDR